MRDFLRRYVFTQNFWEHVFSCIGILLILYVCKDFVIFFLTAFLCGYLFQDISRWSQKKIHHFTERTPKKRHRFLTFLAQEKALLTIYYVLFALICVFAVQDIGPALITDLIALLQSLSQKLNIDMGIDNLQHTLNQWQGLSSQFSNLINIISPSTDTNTLLAQFFRIGSIFFQVLFGYVLSFIWLLEYEKVERYFLQLKQSPFAFFYNDLRIIFQKITKSFWLVFQAQGQIAVVNTLLTVIGLTIIGIIFGPIATNHSYFFPYLLALWCITFLTSFIPMLGIFIGGIPILFAGASGYPGWGIIITLLSMLLVIHTIEGYFLNPRLVGKSLNIPSPVIFMILLVSEHFMGIAGFFLGVPVYLLLTEFINALATKITEKKETETRKEAKN